MKALPRLLIIGSGTHGKNTVGDLLEKFGFKCISSSTFLTEKVMIPCFKSIGIEYAGVEDAYEDRVNHRPIWFREIEKYNEPTWNRTAREIFVAGYNVHIGIRSRLEFIASRYLFDYVIWVDASNNSPSEDSSSNELSAQDADFVLDNNGTLKDLETNVINWYNQFMGGWDG